MFLLISIAFTAIPKREDALFSQPGIMPIIEASGSLGLRSHDLICTSTHPNQTLVEDEELDWCSNIAKTTNDLPWISFHLLNKGMKIRGYSIRNGCCHKECCCDPETDTDFDAFCCCRLYRFSLQGSNDNKTWKTIHKVEKDPKFHLCQYKTYDFDLSESFNIVRFIMEEEYPHCPKCLQINQIELYGETVSSTFFPNEEYNENDENDESISIIGRVHK